MRILQSKDKTTFMCHMNGQSFQSTDRAKVSNWRDEQMKGQKDYIELLNEATQIWYDKSETNYKGD